MFWKNKSYCYSGWNKTFLVLKRRKLLECSLTHNLVYKWVFKAWKYITSQNTEGKYQVHVSIYFHVIPTSVRIEYFQTTGADLGFLALRLWKQSCKPLDHTERFCWNMPHLSLSPDVPSFCFNCRLGFYYYYLKACHWNWKRCAYQ